MVEFYSWLTAFDFAAVAVVIFASRSFLTFFHPLFWYLIWHAVATSGRLVQLAAGSPPLYGDSLNFLSVTSDEILRATVWSDIALLVFYIGALLAHSIKLPRIRSRRFLQPSLHSVYQVAFWTFPPGILCFVMLRLVSRQFFDAIGLGSYVIIISMWPLTLLCIFIYFRGFTKPLVIATTSILIITSLQGYHRFMVLIPSIYLALVYIMRGRGRYKLLKLAIPSLTAALIIPYLKPVGQAFQSGDYTDAISILFSALIFNGVDGSPINFLDQFSAALTLIDQSGQFWFGTTYVSLLLLPIPRALWAGKPSLGQHVIDIATVDRPFDEEGRVITYLGEAYVNFSNFGLLLIPFVCSYFFTRYYLSFMRSPPNSFFRLCYLFILPASIQMYRDGLTSIVLFGLIFNMPLIILWLVSREKEI